MNMKVEEQDEIENPDLFNGSLDDLRRSINRHERSAKADKYLRQKGNNTLEIEEKLIEIKFGKEKKDNNASAITNEIGLPQMDSHEGSKKDLFVKKKKEDNCDMEMRSMGLFEQSPTSTFQDLQHKLEQIVSPSDSKISESHNSSQMSQSSIPHAHHEYEKILRQLETECRHHIRCEQQMKLHIDSLQEKLETALKDQKKLFNSEKEMERLQKELKQFVDLSKKVEQDAIKLQEDLGQSQKTCAQLKVEKNKLILKLREREEALEKLTKQIESQQNQIATLKTDGAQAFSSCQFGIIQPISTNSNKMSAHTNVGGVSQKKPTLIFEERKVSQKILQQDGHRIKRSLPDYSDILLKNQVLESVPKRQNRTFGLVQSSSQGQQVRSQSVLKPTVRSEYLTAVSPSTTGKDRITHSKQIISTRQQQQQLAQKRKLNSQRNTNHALITAITSQPTAQESSASTNPVSNESRLSKMPSRTSIQPHSKSTLQTAKILTSQQKAALQQNNHSAQQQQQSHNPYSAQNFSTSSFHINAMKKNLNAQSSNSSSASQLTGGINCAGPIKFHAQQLDKQTGNQIVKITKPKQIQQNLHHHKTKSTYVTAIAQSQVQNSGFGAPEQEPDNQSAVFYSKAPQKQRATSQQRDNSNSVSYPCENVTNNAKSLKQLHSYDEPKSFAEGATKLNQVLHQSLSQKQVSVGENPSESASKAKVVGTSGDSMVVVQKQKSHFSNQHSISSQAGKITGSQNSANNIKSNFATVTSQSREQSQKGALIKSGNAGASGNATLKNTYGNLTQSNSVGEVIEGFQYNEIKKVGVAQKPHHARNKSEVSFTQVTTALQAVQNQQQSFQHQHRHGVQQSLAITKQKTALKKLQKMGGNAAVKREQGEKSVENAYLQQNAISTDQKLAQKNSNSSICGGTDSSHVISQSFSVVDTPGFKSALANLTSDHTPPPKKNTVKTNMITKTGITVNSSNSDLQIVQKNLYNNQVKRTSSQLHNNIRQQQAVRNLPSAQFDLGIVQQQHNISANNGPTTTLEDRRKIAKKTAHKRKSFLN